MSKHEREKCRILSISSILSYKKGHNSYRKWRKLTTLKLDLKYSKTKSYAKFQLNMSKHVREKCRKLYISSFYVPKGALLLQKLTHIDNNRTWSVVWLNKVICKISAQYIKACKRKVQKLCIFSILSSKRGITPTKNSRHSNLIYSTVKQVICKISAQYVKACKRKVRKTLYFQYSKFQKGITPTKIDANWQHSNLICSTVKQSHMQNLSSICQSMEEKSAENCVFSVF